MARGERERERILVVPSISGQHLTGAEEDDEATGKGNLSEEERAMGHQEKKGGDESLNKE